MDRQIEYNLTRSNRKTISIYIERNASITVLAPNTLSKSKIDEYIYKRQFLIYKHIAEWEELNSSRVLREITNGETFRYLGRNYRLRIVEGQEEPLMLSNGYFCISAQEKSNAKKHFKDFYKQKGIQRISSSALEYSKKMGLNFGSIRVMELKNRWASCSRVNNDLNFHWKCIMAPITILDYIVVHELAHLKYPTHNEKFWNEVDKIMPDYHSRKEWLKVNGASMEL
ncbi:MAG: M48 family metallopeptidase [Candidatus Kuenenia stuttgartiensis]|nr:M48 family metallopeptidase [Candidatus Kuenenia stuttgartiensis]